jgi:hypothetical protein
MHQKTVWIFRAHFLCLFSECQKLGVAICFFFCKDRFSLFHLGGILNWSGKMVNTTENGGRLSAFLLFCIAVLIKVDARGR